MVVANNQRWLTSAGDDEEAWKCILLGRSLRRSLTTRLICVFVSDQVSDELREKLEDEFDVCTKIGGSRLKQHYPGLSFSLASKLSAWSIRGLRKFVFLDPNSLVIKNSDELFRKSGLRVMEGADKKIGLLIGNTLGDGSRNLVKEQKILLKFENRLLGEAGLFSIYPRLENRYGVNLNWEKPGSNPITGDQWKIICFPNRHPLGSSSFEDGWEDLGLGIMEKIVVELCGELVPEKLRESRVTNDPIARSPNQGQQQDLSDSIAIVGMSCRFPGANNVDEFWKLLEQGKEGICRVPEGRWTKDNSLIRLTDVRSTEAGFLACPVDRFDAKFFNTNSADMAFMDPQQRLTLKIVWESLEHAGIDPETLKNSLTGVFGGWWRNDYKEILQQVGIINETEFFRAYMGNALGTLTARISHFFELVGPSVSTESGCSTSIVGVDLACDSLKNENCDVALAVGANMLLHPFSVNLMNTVIAMDGRCKTFDADADGFGRAEGVAALVLKRYPDAVAAGDRIWGLIRGSAVVQEGTSKSMGTPTVDSEALAMELALERAGVLPKDVSFVETHGTGTPVGDPLEMAAVAKVYSKDRTEVLTVGSVKTNIGHTESACGIAGIIKTVLSMKYGLIPKHLNFNNLNPDINLTAIPAQLPLQAIEWRKRADGKPRIAGVSSFGITGTDAHVIVQETPDAHQPLSISETKPIKIFTLSGKSEDSLALQLKACRDFIQTTDLSLDDVEFTQHTGRPHFAFRKAILAKTKEEFLAELDQELGKPLKKMKPSEHAPKICFLFTGQGSQYPGMAKSLYESSLVFQTHFDQCEAILNKSYGFQLKGVLWGDKPELLKRTLYSQTSIFCIEYCLLKLWNSWGIKADTCVGHSLGEFAAAVASDILSFEDALRLVATRSKLIDDLPNASMIVVGASLKTVETLLKQIVNIDARMWLDVAAVNSNEQSVLAGPSEFVKKFATYCENNNLKSHILDASHAFHSRLMDPILEKYEAVAATVAYQEPKNCKFISGMEGQVVAKVDADYWVKHTRDRVRFLDASEAALKDGNSVFLEIGPHPVLTSMVMLNSDSVDVDEPISCHASLRKKTDDWDTILTTLSKLYTMGFPINWDNFHRFSRAKKVDLPRYVFEEKQYWLSIHDDGSIPFHPLLGGYLPNPSPTKIFRNDLSVNRVPFLKDHALGDKLIFPGAGYLEMCLTAGYAAAFCPEGFYTKPSSGVSVRNFCIDSPVCLNEKSATEFQVVVNKGTESGDATSTVYTKIYIDSTNFKWIRHASASFHPSPNSLLEIPSLDNIKTRCTEQVSSCHDYKEIEELGYNFGPSFKTLTAAWTGQDESLQEFLFEFKSTENADPFIVHPCVIDAMFQAQVLSVGLKMKKLNSKTMLVPLQIESFTCWSPLQSHSGYIYVTPSKTNGEKDVHLFGSDGALVATMLGTEFVETTLNNIMALIDSQRNPYPGMYDIVWRDSLGPCERRVDAVALATIPFPEPDPLKYNTFSDEEEEFYQNSNTLFALYMIQALKKLGIEDVAKVGSEIQWPDIGESLGVVPGLHKFLRYILMELVADGWLQVTHASQEKTGFKIVKQFPDCAIISSGIESTLSDIRRKQIGVVDVNAVEPLGKNLAEILSGKVLTLSILFPEGTNVRGPAEQYYTDSLFQMKNEILTQKFLPQFIYNCCQLPGNKSCVGKPIIRILEVGAGTGASTKLIIPHMLSNNNSSRFEYTFTDISNAFLHKGEEIFENTGILAKFNILNIEEDPFAQGFIPGHYDAVIATYVVHATRNIEETINNMKKLLTPNGHLTLLELTEPNRAINLLFGGLEQFWSFTDLHLRPFNCEMAAQKWKETIYKCGFVDFQYLSSFKSKNSLICGRLEDIDNSLIKHNTILSVGSDARKLPTWVIFGQDGDPISQEAVEKLQASGRTVVFLTTSQFEASKLEEQIFSKLNQSFNKDSGVAEGIAYLWGLNQTRNYQEICEPFLYIGKYLTHSDVNVRIITFVQGLQNVGPSSDYVFSRPDASPIIGMMGAMLNEIPGSTAKCVDIDPSSSEDTDIINEAVTELFTPDHENLVAYRKSRRLLPRLQPYKIRNTALTLPSSRRYRMILPTSNMISDLRFAPYKLAPLDDEEIEVEVKAYALNFRDLMVVIKPDPVFESFTTVGIDFSGVVTAAGPNATLQIGDRVLGARNDGTAMPSHVVCKGDHVFKIPEKMTFADAATLPVAFTTVSLCFLDIAKIKEGDVILIHTGSGGVGLAAIIVAQWKKCKIVATAGSERKRKYLRNLGVEYVFNSRTTEYENDIKKALGGRGVDVVLNSLTGPGFKEATLAVCAQGARFVEISKMNIWSREEVQALRPDVMYQIADLSEMNEDEITATFKPVKAMLDKNHGGETRPLPYTRFDLTEIREALEYMQKARHLGKIVITMPEVAKNSSDGDSKINLFNDNATYMITGGLGGIGLEVAKWMSRNGATSLVLVGRSPPTKVVDEELEEIRSRGIRVIVSKCDIGNFEECQKLIEEINNQKPEIGGESHQGKCLPPLRGIMHAAGVLADGTLEGQNWEKYETVFNAKIKGSWNLHELTLHQNYPLEHFVMFSSLAAVFGSVAQSNHAAGNYFLDSLVHYRNSLGLPGTTVNWAQWGQVGVAANLNIPGMSPFTVVQGLAALEHVLKSHKSQMSVCEGDVSMARKAFPSTKQLLAEIQEGDSNAYKELDGDEFWKEYDAAETRGEKYDVVRKYIKTILRLNLKMDKNEEIDDNANFQDIGMDSLMMVEMKSALQTSVGKRVKISIVSVKDCKTVAQLSLRLVELISGKEELPPPSREELKEIIIEDSILPENISAENSTIKDLKPLSSISTVLVTGATGTLGPYVVYEILKQPSIQKVYCLMRENKLFTPLERFKRIFKEKKLLPLIDMNKIDFVIGDVAEPKLGLEDDDFTKLGQEVDAIFHLAVKASLDEFYSKSDDPKHSRNINISGIKNVLTFSVEGRLKYVYHASTIIAETQMDSDDRFWEDWPIEGEFDNQPNSAYPISKYICDRLVSQAVCRGVPCKAFRFPNIGGDSVTGGNFQIMDSHLMIRMLAYMHMGFMPAQNLPMSILPVDTCAKFSVALFFNEKSGFEMFNVANPYIFDEREFNEVAAEFGVELKVLDPDEFLEKLKKLDTNDDVIQIVRIALAREHDREIMEDNLPDLYIKWLQGDKKVLLSKKLSLHLPNEYPKSIKSSLEILKRDLQFAKDSGVFDKFGIKYTDSS